MASQPDTVEGLVRARLPHAENQARLTGLARRGWVLVADDSPHPLRPLQGRHVDGLRLHVLLGGKNRFGATYFQVFLQDSQGRTSQEPALVGLHSSGRYPAYNWIEVISLAAEVSLGHLEHGAPRAREVKLQGELLRQFLQCLSDVIPTGGHMMVEYDSPEQCATERALAAGMPPAATPLGSLLLEVGCGAGFKDWHFAEGGSEGPRKLMGFKALTPEAARDKLWHTRHELLNFLERPRPGPVSPAEAAGLRQAADVLRKLTRGDSELARRTEAVAAALGL